MQDRGCQPAPAPARPRPRKPSAPSSAAAGPTHSSIKSFNNHWGVPLMLARMPREAQFAVFEIGMNHAGEITPLAQMVRPHVAVITTVAAAHLEFFKSVTEIAEAKAEIFLGLEPGGVAVAQRRPRLSARCCSTQRGGRRRARSSPTATTRRPTTGSAIPTGGAEGRIARVTHGARRHRSQPRGPRAATWSPTPSRRWPSRTVRGRTATRTCALGRFRRARGRGETTLRWARCGKAAAADR